MKKEHTLVAIAGFLLLAYLLDAVVDPLTLRLATPYQYFNPQTLSTYPFTTTSILMKAISVFLIPLWFFSLFPAASITKALIFLVLSALLQLYAVQDIATGHFIVPLEWSLAFTLSGLALLIPALLYFIHSLLKGVGNNIQEQLEPTIPQYERPKTLHSLKRPEEID